MDGPVSCKTCVHEEQRRLDLIVTDGHDGLLAAVKELFAATPSPRWKVTETTQCVECHP